MTEPELIAGGLQQLNRLAVEAAEAGHLEDALILFRKALEFEERLNLGEHAAETLMNIATTCLMLGKVPDALKAVEDAEQRFASRHRHEDRRKAAILKGSMLMARGSWADAACQFESCLRLSPPPEERASICAQAAAAMEGLQQYFRAQEYLGRAISEYGRLGDPERQAAVLKQRARLFKTAGRRDLAMIDLRRCSMLVGSITDPNTEYELLS